MHNTSFKRVNRDTSRGGQYETEDGFRREDFPTFALLWPGVLVRTSNPIPAEDKPSTLLFETEDGYRPSDYPIRPLLYSVSAQPTSTRVPQFPFQSGGKRKKAFPARQLKCRPLHAKANGPKWQWPSRHEDAPSAITALDGGRRTDVPTWKTHGPAAGHPASGTPSRRRAG